jgi:hypothetical protein
MEKSGWSPGPSFSFSSLLYSTETGETHRTSFDGKISFDMCQLENKSLTTFAVEGLAAMGLLPAGHSRFRRWLSFRRLLLRLPLAAVEVLVAKSIQLH